MSSSTPSTIAASGDALDPALRAALELGAERTQKFATEARNHLSDFETELAPGVRAGHRYIPVQRVGAYLPAGRFPILASAFMTVGVAKAAGVPTVLACTPPQPDGRPDPAVLYAAHLSGADRVFVLGGVQALAAMAFGLLGEAPVDMLVGAGNAYVTEAKRQLFGTVSIDLLAGPSEVAVIADETADPEIVAADLLGQAEHGPDSPAALVTTSEALGRAVIDEVERQLATLATAAIAGPAWRDHGSVTWAADKETAAALMDDLAPEHLEINTRRRRLLLRHAAQLRIDLRRSVEHRRLLRQGHGRHQPRAADGRRRPPLRRALGRPVPQAAHLPARRAGGDAVAGRGGRRHLRRTRGWRRTGQRPRCASQRYAST